MRDIHVELAKSKSIVEYLTVRGLNVKKRGTKYFCSSPFSSDSEPSFCVYPNNSYYDFSTGKGGDIIALVSELEQTDFKGAVHNLLGNTTSKVKFKRDSYEEAKKPFKLESYLTTEENYVEQINKYANGRRITEGYVHSVFFNFEDGEWIKTPAMGFVHLDENLEPCGIKMRMLHNESKTRFTARGTLKFYVLENLVEDSFEEPVLYIMESETSANSFYMYLKEQKINGIVMSVGGVSNAPEKLPEQFDNLKRKLIIDYDGNKELFLERLQLYNHLGAEPVKIQLEKGEDINSLYVKNKMYLIENLI